MINFSEKEFYNKLNCCKNCKLCETRSNVVIGYGKTPSEIMIIGEAPSEKEDIEGRPFVGRSGKLLTELLKSINIDRDDIYISNIVKCRPPSNRNPEDSEIKTCKRYLAKQIAYIVKPKIIILLGSVALKTMLGRNLKITQNRGRFFKKSVPYMKQPVTVIPMFHPSYLLRNHSMKKGSPKDVTLNDLDRIKHFLVEPF